MPYTDKDGRSHDHDYQMQNSNHHIQDRDRRNASTTSSSGGGGGGGGCGFIGLGLVVMGGWIGYNLALKYHVYMLYTAIICSLLLLIWVVYDLRKYQNISNYGRFKFLLLFISCLSFYLSFKGQEKYETIDNLYKQIVGDWVTTDGKTHMMLYKDFMVYNSKNEKIFIEGVPTFDMDESIIKVTTNHNAFYILFNIRNDTIFENSGKIFVRMTE